MAVGRRYAPVSILLRYHTGLSHHDYRITYELCESASSCVCVCLYAYSLCVCAEVCVNVLDSKDYITEKLAAAGHCE